MLDFKSGNLFLLHSNWKLHSLLIIGEWIQTLHQSKMFLYSHRGSLTYRINTFVSTCCNSAETKFREFSRYPGTSVQGVQYCVLTLCNHFQKVLCDSMLICSFIIFYRVRSKTFQEKNKVQQLKTWIFGETSLLLWSLSLMRIRLPTHLF